MQIKITYVGTLNGANGFWCGFLPDGVVVTEERPILFAEDGYELERIADGENVGNSIWLHDGDTQENYREVPAQEEIEEEVE